MSDVKIVRLTTGEDIISFVIEIKNNDVIFGYKLIYPMYFVLNGDKLGLDHFLPVRILSQNHIIIKPKDVFGIMEPSPEFANYYSDTVDKFEQLDLAKININDMNDEAINDLLNTIEPRYSYSNNIN